MQTPQSTDVQPASLPGMFQKPKWVLYIYYAALFFIIISAFQSYARPSLSLEVIDAYGNIQRLNTGIVLGNSLLDGISPLGLLPSLEGFFLLVPVALAIVLIVALFRNKFQLLTTQWKRILIYAAISLGIIILWRIFWWFDAAPAIGFWLTLLGVLLLAATGFMLNKDPIIEYFKKLIQKKEEG